MRHVLFAVAVLLAFAGGLSTGVFVPQVRSEMITAKRHVRERLGLEKRWMQPARRDPGDRDRADCPAPDEALVLVTGGQSNAANTNSSLSRVPAGRPVFTWYRGACWRTRDPVLGAGGRGGSLWPDLGARLSAALDRPVILLNGAIGGTQVADWVDRRSGYLDNLEGAMADIRDAGYRVDWILWHQGETDAAVIESRAPFETALTELTQELEQAAPEALIYMFRASRCGRRGGPDSDKGRMVTGAQTAVAGADPRVVAGMDTDVLGPDFRRDGCHFNGFARDRVNAVVLRDLVALTAALPGAGAGARPASSAGRRRDDGGGQQG